MMSILKEPIVWENPDLYLFVMNSDGTKTKSLPRPIIATFSSWKQKEAILATARKVKPKQIKFFQDLSSKTLKKRAEKIPDLIRERKKRQDCVFYSR